MGFRDDRQALLGRIESLEAELRSAGGPVRREALQKLEELARTVRQASDEVDETRDTLAELAARIDRIRTDVGGTASAPRGARRAWLGVAALFVIAIGTAFAICRSPTIDRDAVAPVQPTRATSPAPRAPAASPAPRCVPGTIERAGPQGRTCTFEGFSLPAAPDVSPYCGYLGDGYMGFMWRLTDATRDHACPEGMTRADNPQWGYCLVRGIEAPDGAMLLPECDDLSRGRLGYRIVARTGPPARVLPAPDGETPDAPLAAPRLAAPGAIGCDLSPSIASLGSCSRLDVVAVAASGSDPSRGAAAVDRDACTVWSSGAFAPQAISLDLGRQRAVSALLLVTETTPDGATTVVVELSDDGETFAPAALIRGEIATQRAYAVDFPRPLEARHVRLRSTRSRSWIAWREIAALSCEGE
ncbi:MAG: discoidin domain-containing protein [Deltaproteobacteria bacterium]|nr:discoidin domain-containing protein [Deltaproteobacteria bacterium]